MEIDRDSERVDELITSGSSSYYCCRLCIFKAYYIYYSNSYYFSLSVRDDDDVILLIVTKICYCSPVHLTLINIDSYTSLGFAFCLCISKPFCSWQFTFVLVYQNKQFVVLFLVPIIGHYMRSGQRQLSRACLYFRRTPAGGRLSLLDSNVLTFLLHRLLYLSLFASLYFSF